MNLPVAFQSTKTGYFSIPLVMGFCTVLAALKAGPAIINIAAIMLGLWGLSGNRQALQALSLTATIKFLNPVLYSFSTAYGIISWLLLIILGMRIFLSTSLHHFKAILPLLGFSTVVLLLSALQDNPNPDISAMKLFIFTYGAAALLVGYAGLDDTAAHGTVTWIICLTVSVILLSLPTLAVPAVAYAKNGTGFQGIMNHPQVLGPMLAPLTAWILAGTFFNKGGGLLGPWSLAIFLIILMIMSEARTSAVAVLLALGSTFIVVFFQKRRFTQFRPSRLILVSVAVLMTLAIALALSNEAAERLMGFVFKHQNEMTLDAALSSRRGGIESQWYYFLHKPLTGNGFGVYAWGDFPSGVVRVMGIPISASVEKGFLPTAILEEVGIPGTIAFLYFLISLGRRVVSAGQPTWLAIFFACFFINMGEMVFFSLGGIGLLYWSWFGLSIRMGTISTFSSPFLRQTFTDKTEGKTFHKPCSLTLFPEKSSPTRVVESSRD